MENRSEGGLALVVVGVLLAAVILGAVGGFFFLRTRARLDHQRNLEHAQAAAAHERMTRTQKLAELHAKLRDATVDTEQGEPSAAASVAVDHAAELKSNVTLLLERQQAAWNQGDLDAFMEPYWKSDQLTFSSGGQVRRGWDATMQRYRETYPTPEKMGKLTLSGIEVTSLAATTAPEDTAALVLGEWKLERAEEPVGGNFSLVVRKIDGQWVIIHDHTSRAAD